MVKLGILVNRQLCNGCYTCSLMCKAGNHLADDEWWHMVQTLPSGKTDEPAGTWPNLQMSWQGTYFPECTLCSARTATGQEPFCVYNCPNKALTYGDLDDPASKISLMMREVTNKGYRIYQLPNDQKVTDPEGKQRSTKAGIYYAEKA